MAETLDGGAPPYRSNRHFDILNENILFAMQGASQASDYRSIFEERRTSFGQGLVLLNTVSHDEKNYSDPWQAYIRYAVCNTVDGAPMIFPGQELGISEFFGYDLMEINFGKHIPHFKTYNSMMPLWNDADYGNDQLYPAHAAIGEARRNSPALRSSNRWYLNQKSTNEAYEAIFSVAKYETANASPAVSDVVLCFVNLRRSENQASSFNVNITANGSNLFGIKSNRIYNTHNIAAFGGIDPNRKNSWVWGGGLSGADILNNGVYVSLNPVPTNVPLWTSNPYEPQYLKLYDITAPPAPTSAPVHVAGTSWVLGDTATFTWAAVIDPEGVVPRYRVILDRGGGNVTTSTTMQTSMTVTGLYGETVSVRIVAENPEWAPNASAAGPASAGVLLLDPSDDQDHDGLPNWAESVAGTDLFNSNSVFVVEQVATPGAGGSRLITVATEPGRRYTIYFSDDAYANTMNWTAFANLSNAIGTWLETNTVSSVRTFVDDEGPNTTLGPPAGGIRSYRFTVEDP